MDTAMQITNKVVQTVVNVREVFMKLCPRWFLVLWSFSSLQISTLEDEDCG
jgi:hypothetical protein